MERLSLAHNKLLISRIILEMMTRREKTSLSGLLMINLNSATKISMEIDPTVLEVSFPKGAQTLKMTNKNHFKVEKEQ